VQSLKALVLAKEAELRSRTTAVENRKLLTLKRKLKHFGPRSENFDRDIQPLGYVRSGERGRGIA
jgi:hypothetical protein